MTRRVIIFVEGFTDRRFVETVFARRLRDAYPGGFKVSEYATGCSPSKLCRLVAHAGEAGYDYFIIGDLDEASCCTKKRQGLCATYPGVCHDRILVAAKEIEAWYLAGLDKKHTAALGIAKYHPATDRVSKEEFNRIRPRRFKSRIDFMREVLKVFDLDHAVNSGRNRSLAYCAGRLAVGASPDT